MENILYEYYQVIHFFLKFATMDTLQINILNPKATKLLNDLADLNLISIQNSPKSGFKSVLKRLRAKSKSAPSLEEITKEVELVRAKRYAK